MLLLHWKSEAEKDKESIPGCVIKLVMSHCDNLFHLWKCATEKLYQLCLRTVIAYGGRKKRGTTKKRE